MTCDIWKLPRRNMSMELVELLASEFHRLGVEFVALSGGEAMQHPEWPLIASRFRQAGASILLFTNGILLRKQAEQVINVIDSVTISLDGANPKTYKEIRGVDALPVILEGMRIVADAGIPIRTRTTIQRRNFREIPQIIDTAIEYGARSVSFLGVDIASSEAFGPRFPSLSAVEKRHAPPSSALTNDELPEFAKLLDYLEQKYAEHFIDGRIVESPKKLRALYNYFAAVNGLIPFSGPPCNAPHVSAVIEVDGKLRPCFFLPAGPKVGELSLSTAINHPHMLGLRRAFRSGKLKECERCVCPLDMPRN